MNWKSQRARRCATLRADAVDLEVERYHYSYNRPAIEAKLNC